MAKVKKITSGEGHKAPFRLFGNINHTPRTFTAGEFSAVFSVRPMRADERARMQAAERRLNQSHDYLGARDRAGVSDDMIDADKVAEKLGVKYDHPSVLEQLNKTFLLIDKYKTIVPDEYARFAVSTREAIVACCESVEVDGVVTKFDGCVWESMPSSVQMWLKEEVEKESYLTEDEEVGL